jgi:hypothetical protein
MAGLKLTMALSHYDRHLPFFDGSVQAEGVDLRVLEVGQSEPLKHGRDRHERMLQKGEFDVCKLSLSSYLMAKSRGMPFTAIPVFPRRLSKSSLSSDTTFNATVPLADVAPLASHFPLQVTVGLFGVTTLRSEPADCVSLSFPTHLPAPAEQLRNQRSVILSDVGPELICFDE